MGEAIVSVRQTTVVDLQFENIKKIEGLDKPGMFIEKIDLRNNQIVTIEGLIKCKNLVRLNLGCN